MLNTETILSRADEILKKQGASIQSRQIRALAQVFVEEINAELKVINLRLKP